MLISVTIPGCLVFLKESPMVSNRRKPVFTEENVKTFLCKSSNEIYLMIKVNDDNIKINLIKIDI